MTPTRFPNQKRMLTLLRWLRHNPQHSVPAALLAVYLGVWLFRPHYKPPVPPTPPPVPVVAPVPAPSVKSAESKSNNTPALEHTEIIQEGHNVWKWESWRINTGDGDYTPSIRVYRNGQKVKAFSGEELNCGSVSVGRLEGRTRFPVVSVTLNPLGGHAGTMLLYTMRNGRLIEMGAVGAEYGGPIFHDYDGDGRPEWVFDDYHWYEYQEEGPKYLKVYKELKNGKLKLWKTLPNPHRHHLPYRLGQEDMRT